MSVRSSHTLHPVADTTFVHSPPDGLSASPSLTLTAGTGAAAGSALDPNVHLQLLFQYYCRFGRSGVDHDIDTMDCVMFAKFTRDCPELLDKVLNPTEVDLLFVKAKAKAQRRLTYGQVRCEPPSPGAPPPVHARTRARAHKHAHKNPRHPPLPLT